MSDVLVYVGGIALAMWGLSHLAPTRSVADSFGEISANSRRVLVMEWVAEGLTHISIAVLVVVIAALETGAAVDLVYRVSAGLLVALAVLTILTGARTPVLWFKVCPLVLTSVATLLVVASLL
jgi:hypothetical protein